MGKYVLILGLVLLAACLVVACGGGCPDGTQSYNGRCEPVSPDADQDDDISDIFPDGDVLDGDNADGDVSDGAITFIDGGGLHTCSLSASGGLFCWGRNNFGQLGIGNTNGENVPTLVPDLSSGVQTVAAGAKFTCALLESGGVQCWGYNVDYQLGNGTTENALAPTDVSGLSSGVRAISAGGSFACALMESGGLKCWGYNLSGQIGDGTHEDRSTPTDVSGLASGVPAVEAGSGHVCALLEGGTVKCWGSNEKGQLGDGTTFNSDVPLDVAGLPSGVKALAAGFMHTCALLDGGAVRCWGANRWGQLGLGTSGDDTSPAVPQDVSGLSSGVTMIAAGSFFTCALLETGAVKCWGSNEYGQIGNGGETGQTTHQDVPADVSGLSGDVGFLAAGAAHACALLSRNRIKCWGYNLYGQLGDGTHKNQTTPVDVW